MKWGRQHPIAFLAGLLLCGCDETASDCIDNEQWCKDFTLMPLGAVNRADSSGKLLVRFETANATPSYETNFRVSIEQTPNGMTAMGSGTNLSPPSSLESGWDVTLAKPLPELGSLQCGAAKLYLHARVRGHSLQTPLVPGTDSTSANYRQHGVTEFTVVDERPVLFWGKGQMTGGSALSNLGLHNNGGSLYIYSTQDEAQFRFTSLGVGTLLAQQANPIVGVTAAENFQFIGETTAARLLIKKVPGVSACPGTGSWLTACTQLTSANDPSDTTKCFPANMPFTWCFPAKSNAADASGSYFASVAANQDKDKDDILHIYNSTIDTGAKNLTFKEWMTGQYTGYRHVTIGDVDGDGAMDILALHQSGEPLILLREKKSFNEAKKSAAEELAKRLAEGSTETSAGDAVATIGRFDRCARYPDILLASAGAVYALTQQMDQSFVKKKLSLDQFPSGAEITALLLTNTDANRNSDLLFVAIKPDIVYIYKVQ